MEEITQAAKAAYEHFSEDQKREVKEFFSAMDENGDGKISLQECMSFFQEVLADWSRLINHFVDQNRDDTLGFDQVLTLFYLKARGWYICDGCDVFIMSGLFFTCTRCRLSKNDGKSCDLCIPCYHGRKFKHEHTEFLDNHAVLSNMGMMPFPPPSREKSKTQDSRPSGSRSKMEKMKVALQVFQAALSVITNVSKLAHS